MCIHLGVVIVIAGAYRYFDRFREQKPSKRSLEYSDKKKKKKKKGEITVTAQTSPCNCRH